MALNILNTSVNNIAAFLYFQLAEHPVLNDYDPDDPDSVAEASAADLLFYGTSDSFSVDPEKVRLFIMNVDALLQRLHSIHDNQPDDWTEENIQSEFYESAKATFGTDKREIRQFFIYLYQMLTHTSNGPRWGQFVMICGIDNFTQRLQERFSNPFMFPGEFS